MRRIYTGTGDAGETGLKGGRTGKDSPVIEAMGTLDELHAVLGLLRAEISDRSHLVSEPLLSVQRDLFTIISELAGGPGTVAEDRVRVIEGLIDDLGRDLPPLEGFILAGGGEASSRAHHARTVARRAERRIVSLSREDRAKIRPEVMAYMNRLSDLLFVIARYLASEAGEDESPAHPDS